MSRFRSGLLLLPCISQTCWRFGEDDSSRRPDRNRDISAHVPRFVLDVVRDSRSRQDLSVRVLPNHRPDELAMDSAVKFYRYHRSPLYQVADALKHIDMETLETIIPFTLARWEPWTVPLNSIVRYLC
jgi:hypothetical protein